jgi:uncharacterized repeat protein (TIGR03803 family)
MATNRIRNLQQNLVVPVLLILTSVILAGLGNLQAQTSDDQDTGNSALPPAASFKSLDSFNVTNGLTPVAMSLVQGLDGNLYGTTEFGGANLPCNSKQVGCGTVFKMTPSGVLTTLYSFCSLTNCADGAYPIGGLLLATDGNLYGMTSSGGKIGYGEVYKVTPAGVVSTVYSFCEAFGCTDGRDPNTPLVQGTDGNLYGTTVLGGTGGCGGCHGGGVAFKLTLGGKFTDLHSFCTGTCLDYGNPANPLVQGSDGNFYSVITGRSGYSNGNLFKMTPAGTVTILYNFCALKNCADGSMPVGSLVQGSNGNFYGTTSAGGTSNNGTIYEITPAGKLTTLLNFDYTTAPLGALPEAGLVLASNGVFYGTAFQGGLASTCVFGCGTIFDITAAGKLTTLHEFNGSGTGSDGAGPYGLVQHTNGTFFGTTTAGGAKNDGTLFSLADGARQFVLLLPYYGKVGATIDILGQGLSGTTSVSFNGTPATFTAVSSTYITAVVPVAATSGTVTVVTSTATLTSNRKFLVRPASLTFAPPNGPVGTVVTITGTGLTGATKVTFGGVAATVFTVDSSTQITATVPTGAVTGKIAVTTPGGTAISTATFTVN